MFSRVQWHPEEEVWEEQEIEEEKKLEVEQEEKEEEEEEGQEKHDGYLQEQEHKGPWRSRIRAGGREARGGGRRGPEVGA